MDPLHCQSLGTSVHFTLLKVYNNVIILFGRILLVICSLGKIQRFFNVQYDKMWTKTEWSTTLIDIEVSTIDDFSVHLYAQVSYFVLFCNLKHRNCSNL